MTISTELLLEGLNSVISIPLIPFDNGRIDYDGHAKNITYLMQSNTLSETRPRVISIAGTSLIHHIGLEDQVRLVDIAGQEMGSDGILIAALMPNPIDSASDLIEKMSALSRPPDAYLLMPLTGTYSPEGLYDTFMMFTERHANQHDTRFLYYFRRPRDSDAVIRLFKDSPHVVGVKIGTNESDVPIFVHALSDAGLSDRKIVIWGIGDRSTKAVEFGAKGHTSGINIFVAKASDAINNAQRRKDYETARQIESKIAPLEEIRFMNERAYNYAAVVEAIRVSGVDDVVAGTGGPFNPRVPDNVAEEIRKIVESISQFH